ncbi:MAG: hypothetical protein NXI22_16710 [bacterium]|nr:hypothetical protein [bacterium]
MFDIETPRFSKKCAKTGEEFQPNQTYFSVLTAEGADVVRRDYCEAAWEGPPEDAIGWWRSQTPDAAAKKIGWAPNDVMLNYFVNLEEDEEKSDMRFVLALLLIRRRIVRLEEPETDDDGREVMIVYSPKDETTHRVAPASPKPERIAEIQDELAELLFAGAD